MAHEIKRRAGSRIRAPQIPGTVIINIGDRVQALTHERFVSTPHQLIISTGEERYGIPFFAVADFGTVVDSLESCVAAANAEQ